MALFFFFITFKEYNCKARASQRVISAFMFFTRYFILLKDNYQVSKVFMWLRLLQLKTQNLPRAGSELMMIRMRYISIDISHE